MNRTTSTLATASSADQEDLPPTRRDFLSLLVALTCAPLLPLLVPRRKSSEGDKPLPAATSFEIVPVQDRTALDRWKSARRTPVRRSKDPRLQELIQHIEYGRVLRFQYRGGSEPYSLRVISPTSIDFVDEFENEVYLTGYCHHRRAARTFRLDRVRQVEPLS